MQPRRRQHTREVGGKINIYEITIFLINLVFGMVKFWFQVEQKINIYDLRFLVVNCIVCLSLAYTI